MNSMVDLLPRRKDRSLADFEESKPWEKTQDWSNPFDSGESSLRRQRQEDRKLRKRKKKKNRSHRHKLTEEEYSEMSSKADSMLDDLLGDDLDNEGPTMARVNEETRSNYATSNPFDDSEDDEDMHGEEINKDEFNALMKGMKKTANVPSTNPFEEDKDSTAPPGNVDDLSIEPPPKDSTGNNPFEDDSVADSDELKEEEESANLICEQSSPVTVTKKKVDEGLERQPTDTTDEPGESEWSAVEEEDQDEEEEEEENDDDDIIESSKRLLRMADQRLQYQQHNDEVKTLRETVIGLKRQAEAMSEQLRRAVETKCDLVLSQTEMERCHEQNLIAKDDEIRDLKLYIQEIQESQAISEVNFMNEISALSSRLESLTEKHKREVADKNNIIVQLEANVKALQTESGLGNHSMESFRSRLIGSTGSACSPIPVI